MKKSSPAPIDTTPKKIIKKKKKKIVVPVAPVPESQPPQVAETKPVVENTRPLVVTFYGHSIRNTFMNNQWFFSLEDILKIVGVVDPTKFLIDLKNHESIKDKYYQLVESFSYYEGNSPIIIPVANFQNFIQIMPVLRQLNVSFPGPFPDWLREVANRKF